MILIFSATLWVFGFPKGGLNFYNSFVLDMREKYARLFVFYMNIRSMSSDKLSPVRGTRKQFIQLGLLSVMIIVQFIQSQEGLISLWTN